MKFPRNARILHSQLDAAPVASVFFLLIIFVLLGTLVYTPGVSIQLPVASGLTGAPGPRLPMAVDANGQFYFENQPIRESELRLRLQARAKGSTERITLVVFADKATKLETQYRLLSLASQAGMNVHFAAQPRTLDNAPDSPPRPP